MNEQKNEMTFDLVGWSRFYERSKENAFSFSPEPCATRGVSSAAGAPLRDENRTAYFS